MDKQQGDIEQRDPTTNSVKNPLASYQSDKAVKEVLLTLIAQRSDAEVNAALTAEVCRIARGGSIDYVSILRADLLIRFAELASILAESPDTESAALDADQNDRRSQPDQLVKSRDGFFKQNLASLDDGRANRQVLTLRNLAKGVTTLGQFRVFLSRVVSNQVLILRAKPTQLLQCLGSYDPQHIGHRIAIKTAIDHSNCENPYVCVTAMDVNSAKPDIAQTYYERLYDIQWKFFHSTLIDRDRVAVVDLPIGVGIASDTIEHARLLAELHGDDQTRCVVGSDKFRFDLQQADMEQKVGIIGASSRKLNTSDMHMYVVERAGEALDGIRELVESATTRFTTRITLMRQIRYPGEPASSTRCKQYRSSGNPQLEAIAEKMERGDLI